MAASASEHGWAVLRHVNDPEVPVLSVVDLGIVREVRELGTEGAREGLAVVVTPTYSGCPATEVIERSIVDALVAAGLGPVQVELRRSPAWTTDWIGAEARERLRGYGIAPPGERASREAGEAAQAVPIGIRPRMAAAACPRCGSANTERLSAFGATACKSLWRCVACREPFEHFKPI